MKRTRGPVATSGILVFVVVVWGCQGRASRDGLMAAGTIESNRVAVGSLVGGRVARVLIEEGSVVAAGDTLVVFETTMLDPEINEQESRLQEAGSRLALVREGPRSEQLARARIEAAAAERERTRLEPLLERRVVSQQQYDQAAALAATKQETKRELERGSRSSEVSGAEAAVARERARLEQLRARRDESIVRAPVAGIVETSHLRTGDLVGASQPAVELLEADQTWVRVYVPETKLGLVRLQQAASIRIDTFPDRRYSGRVVEIGARAEYTPRNVQTLEQRGDQVFAVKVAIDPNADLRAGMAALVTLDISGVQAGDR